MTALRMSLLTRYLRTSQSQRALNPHRSLCRNSSKCKQVLFGNGDGMGHSLFDLSGKVAVVVGGTSGIGLAMAVGLAEAGADVVATSRRQEQVDEAAALIESRGRKALRLTSDVGDRATLQHLLDETVKAWGKVDILINC